MAKTPTWQRKAGQSESGGLNEAGRASLRAAGHDIKRPQPEGGSRKDSFCARMKGMKAKLTSSETANDPDSRINKSLRKWKCADGGAVDPYDSVQQAAKGGPIWDKPRPKKLGKPEPLSSKEKASAKASAKAAGRPYPNLIDNMRAARADGGELEGDVQFAPDDPYAKVQQAALPMMAREEYAMRMPEPEVRYDTGPQPGEATLKGYEPTIRERIYQGIAGTEERPSPERAQFARGMSQMAEFAPVLGNVMAGEEAQRRGDTKGMLMAALPVPGMATEARMAEAAMSPAQQAAEAAYQRVINAQGLYSHAAEAAANLPQAKGSYEQMMAMLQKAGVKPEEMHWSGVEQFAGQPVTREQLVQHFEQNVPKIEETVLGTGPIHQFGTPEEQEAALNRFNDARNAFWRAEYGSRDYHRIEQEFKDAEAALKDIVPGWGRAEGRQVNPSKFEQYTIPGGENYREVLMHMPAKPLSEAEARQVLGAKPDALLSQADIDYASRKAANEYKSSHWDQPNVLGHLRLSDRTGPEGEKILHMEELQSDWGQAGRKQGFKGQPVKGYAVNWNGRPVATYDSAEEAQAHVQRALGNDPNAPVSVSEVMGTRASGSPEEMSKVPTAPYVASPEGKHTSSWVDLGLKRALKEAAEGGYDKLVWTPGAEQAARYSLSKHIDGLSWSPDTNDLIGFRDGRAEFVKEVPRDKLDEFIGKDAAAKLIETEPYMLNNRSYHHLEGHEMDVGGEGMRGFYDKILPTQLQKLLKRIDPEAKVQMGGHAISKDGEQVGAHSITITPKMREAILKGLPAYAKGGEVVNNADPYDNIQEAARISPRARRASN